MTLHYFTNLATSTLTIIDLSSYRTKETSLICPCRQIDSHGIGCRRYNGISHGTRYLNISSSICLSVDIHGQCISTCYLRVRASQDNLVSHISASNSLNRMHNNSYILVTAPHMSSLEAPSVGKNTVRKFRYRKDKTKLKLQL